MRKLMRRLIVGWMAVLFAAALLGGLAWWDSSTSMAAQAEPEAEPAPPEGQTYTGAKRCASCHFEQFMSWRKDKHSKTFELLPAEYQTDPKCIECHTTGYGEPTGFKDLQSTPNLAGNTCENCHGPGSKHEEVCQALATAKKLTPAQEQQARDSIWMMLPKNVCIECHKTKAHQESETPEELRSKE